MEYHQRRYYGKVNQEFLKIDYELTYDDYNMICIWVILEGYRIRKILLEVEVW